MDPASQAPKAPKASGLVAVALLLGVYVLIAVVVVGCLALAFWTIAYVPNGVAAAKILGVLGLLLFATLSGVVVSLRKPRGELPGIELTPAEQPALWHTVAQLASAVGTRPPDEIRLVAEVNAAVRRHRTGWGCAVAGGSC